MKRRRWNVAHIICLFTACSSLATLWFPLIFTIYIDCWNRSADLFESEPESPAYVTDDVTDDSASAALSGGSDDEAVSDENSQGALLKHLFLPTERLQFELDFRASIKVDF